MPNVDCRTTTLETTTSGTTTLETTLTTLRTITILNIEFDVIVSMFIDIMEELALSLIVVRRIRNNNKKKIL